MPAIQTSLRLHTHFVWLVYSSLWFPLLASFPQSNVYFFPSLQQAYSISLQVRISLYDTSQDWASICLLPNRVLKGICEVDHYSNCFAYWLFSSGWSRREEEMKWKLIQFFFKFWTNVDLNYLHALHNFLHDNFPCLPNGSVMSGHHQILPVLCLYVRLSTCKYRFPDLTFLCLQFFQVEEVWGFTEPYKGNKQR